MMKNLMNLIALILVLAMSVANAKMLVSNNVEDSGLKVTIDVKVFDDIDGDAAEVEEHFTKAFENLGVEVVASDAPDVTALE